MPLDVIGRVIQAGITPRIDKRMSFLVGYVDIA